MQQPTKFRLARRYRQRIRERYDKLGVNDCWQWRSTISRRRPIMYIDGKARSVTRVIMAIQRRRWLEHGEIVLHSCNNTMCCNPRHMKVSTFHELRNGEDEIESVSGSNNGRSKLSAMEVLAIRQMVVKQSQTPGRRSIDAAKRFGISQRQVHRIINGESWL